MLCKEPVIKIVINSVQQQENGVDCGVFALAYTTSLAFGENPSLCSYNMPLMRKRSVNFLEKEMMYPFPKLDNTKRVLKYKKIQLLLSIYCLCRSVCQYEREDRMVECMRRYEWFHQKCEKIPRKVFKNKPIFFVNNAAKDLVSYIVRQVKCQFLSSFGGICYKTSSGFIFNFHCLFLNQFLSLWKKIGTYETLSNN